MSAQFNLLTKWIRNDNRIESTHRQWFEPVGWVVPEIAYTGTQRLNGYLFHDLSGIYKRERISRKEVYKFDRENWHSRVIIHCQIPRNTVLFSRELCPDVSRYEVEENIRNRGKTKLIGFAEEPDIISYEVSVVIFLDFHFNSDKRITGANQNSRLSSVLYWHKFNSQTTE